MVVYAWFTLKFGCFLEQVWRIDLALVGRDDGHDAVLCFVFRFRWGRPVCVLFRLVLARKRTCQIGKKISIKSQIIKSSSKVKAKIWCVHVNRHCTKHHPVSFLSFTTHTHTHTLLFSPKGQDTNRREFKLHSFVVKCVCVCVGGVEKNNKKSGPKLLRLWKRSAGPSCCCGCRAVAQNLFWGLGGGLEKMFVCYCLWLFPSLRLPLWVISAEFQFFKKR